jgi:hypothetical protein
MNHAKISKVCCEHYKHIINLSHAEMASSPLQRSILLMTVLCSTSLLRPFVRISCECRAIAVACITDIVSEFFFVILNVLTSHFNDLQM